MSVRNRLMELKEKFEGKGVEKLIDYVSKRDGTVEWRKKADGKTDVIGILNGIMIRVRKADNIVEEIYGEMNA